MKRSKGCRINFLGFEANNKSQQLDIMSSVDFLDIVADDLSDPDFEADVKRGAEQLQERVQLLTAHLNEMGRIMEDAINKSIAEQQNFKTAESAMLEEHDRQNKLAMEEAERNGNIDYQQLRRDELEDEKHKLLAEKHMLEHELKVMGKREAREKCTVTKKRKIMG
ncbi:hypothetical protein BDZ85DRAFT_266306 [Elsinoe ampelina]|uniref:Uncharacterized protein n=1 Tax=Elsinoe ampelina TaxID=302913 RepID=A0A6A6G669_9PEZI|nr:hypothetical protein BDZ85DRAFT_266306 [Elsinoe ampelina]